MKPLFDLPLCQRYEHHFVAVEDQEIHHFCNFLRCQQAIRVLFFMQVSHPFSEISFFFLNQACF